MDGSNELLKTALDLAARQRAEIDAAFAQMADDQTYQQEAIEITGEFESADWEALRLREKELSTPTSSLSGASQK